MVRPRVFLADDHSDLLDAEISLLRPHFELVGTAGDGVSLVSEVLRLNPDVLVADITMPGMNGIDAAHKLRESGSTARIVFLTIHSSEEFLKACQSEGALGFVSKACMKAHLIPAIHAALNGASYVSPLHST